MDKIKNKLLVVLLLVTLPPVFLIGGYALFSSMGVLQENSIARHKNKVALTAERIENYLAIVSGDLFYLRDSNALHLYFSALKSTSSHSEQLLLTNLRSSLSEFSEQKKIYQQVRFIDTKGREIVRIDRSKDALRACSRPSRAAGSCGRTERRSRNLHGVNEDFEHHPTANGSGVVDLEQVLRNILDTAALQDKSSSEYFKQTPKEGNNALYTSYIGLNRENGKIEGASLHPAIHFAAPVYDKKNTLQGVLVLNVMLDKVFGVIQEQDDGEELTFTAPEGRYYYRASTGNRRDSATDLATKRNLYSKHPSLKGKLGLTKKLVTLETDDGIVTYKSIILNDGKFHLGNLINIAPKAIIYKPARHFLYVFLGVILLTLILSFSLALFLSYSITNPLVQLTDSIDKLSKGNLETPIKITSNDEIGKLAHAVELLRKSMKILMKRAI